MKRCWISAIWPVSAPSIARSCSSCKASTRVRRSVASPTCGASSSVAGSCCWPTDRVPSSPPPAIYGVVVVPMSSSGWGSRVDGVAPRSVPKSSVRQARSGAATGARAASPAHDRSGFSRRGRGNAHGIRGDAGARLGWVAHAAPSVSALDNGRTALGSAAVPRSWSCYRLDHHQPRRSQLSCATGRSIAGKSRPKQGCRVSSG